jgi:hypothetical protein
VAEFNALSDKGAPLGDAHQGYTTTQKYGYDVVLCDKCGAEYLYTPTKLIYDKQARGEYVVDKELFDLAKERSAI